MPPGKYLVIPKKRSGAIGAQLGIHRHTKRNQRFRNKRLGRPTPNSILKAQTRNAAKKAAQQQRLQSTIITRSKTRAAAVANRMGNGNGNASIPNASKKPVSRTRSKKPNYLSMHFKTPKNNRPEVVQAERLLKKRATEAKKMASMKIPFEPVLPTVAENENENNSLARLARRTLTI